MAEKRKGCFMKQNNRWCKLQVTKENELKLSRAIGSRNHLKDHEKEFLNKLGVTKFRQHGSAGLKVAEICKGTAELYFTTTNKIKQWDTCAAHCLIKEAGGMMTDMNGNEMIYNIDKVNHEYGILVSNSKIHQNILSLYKTNNFHKNKIN